MASRDVERHTYDRLAVDKTDIQALARTGFSGLKGAAYLLLRLKSGADSAKARAWLREQAPPTSIADTEAYRGPHPTATSAAADRDHYPNVARQIAFTAQGLLALGVPETICNRFSLEFVEGMSDGGNRSRRLGDIGRNGPEHWHWGFDPPPAAEHSRDASRFGEPHVLLMLFARSGEDVASLADRTTTAAQDAGFAVWTLNTSNMHGYEPFGFRDGVSQPTFDWLGQRTPGTAADRDYTNLIALGELLLGYYNEYGYLTERPLLKEEETKGVPLTPALERRDRYDLGLNGAYLVFRQLEQDVHLFWRWVVERTSGADSAPDGQVSKDAWLRAKEFAEAMVGRGINGEPLTGLEIGRRIAGVDNVDTETNDFNYVSDPEGLLCPLGAHIRRANPRTGDDPGGRQGPIDNLIASLGLALRPSPVAAASTSPWPQNTTVWPSARTESDAVSSARFHRLLRRGREYGEGIDPRIAASTPDDGKKRGLNFLCLNANLGRQFEFVQGAWIASAQFAALSGEQDPLLGNREPFPKPRSR